MPHVFRGIQETINKRVNINIGGHREEEKSIRNCFLWVSRLIILMNFPFWRRWPSVVRRGVSPQHVGLGAAARMCSFIQALVLIRLWWFSSTALSASTPFHCYVTPQRAHHSVMWSIRHSPRGRRQQTQIHTYADAAASLFIVSSELKSQFLKQTHTTSHNTNKNSFGAEETRSEYNNVSFWFLVLRWDTDLKSCYPGSSACAQGLRKRERSKEIQSLNENVIAPEHPSAYLPAIVWGALSTHQLYPGSFNMQPPFDSVQENKFVDLLPHLIVFGRLLPFHSLPGWITLIDLVLSGNNIQFTMHLITLK